MAESLMGITELNANNSKSVLSSLIQTQALQDLIGFELERSSKMLLNISLESVLGNTVIMNMIKELDLSQKAQIILTDVTHRLRTHELALNQLKAGYLPSQYISYQRLKDILIKVERAIPPDMVIGIPRSQIQRYYTSRLTSFQLLEDEIVIHMMIPLSRNFPATQQKMFLAINHPIPVPEDWLREYPARKGFIGPKIKLKFDQKLWIYDSGTFIGEAERLRLNCHEIGDQLSCMSFGTSFTSKNTCSRTLIQGKWKDVKSDCEFMATESTYHPIPIHNGTYMIHRSRWINYTQNCAGFEPQERHLTQMCQTAIIPMGCSLQVNDRQYTGATYDENVTIVYDIPGKIQYLDQTFKQIQFERNLLLNDFSYNRSAKIQMMATVQDIRRNEEEISRNRDKVKRSIGAMQDIIKETRTEERCQQASTNQRLDINYRRICIQMAPVDWFCHVGASRGSGFLSSRI